MLKVTLSFYCIALFLTVVNGQDGGCNTTDIYCKGNSLAWCNADQEETVSCQEVSPGTPYCDCEKNECTNVKKPACATAPAKPCNPEEDEPLPDPQNCSKYIACIGGTQVLMSCPSGAVYDANQQSCVSSNKPVCQILTCPAVKPTNIPFKAFPRYFLHCIGGQGTVQKCTYSNHTMINNKCQFLCTTPGKFTDSDPEVCRKGIWYDCVKYGSGAKQTIQYCLEGNYYDTTAQKCKNKIEVCGEARTEVIKLSK